VLESIDADAPTHLDVVGAVTTTAGSPRWLPG